MMQAGVTLHALRESESESNYNRHVMLAYLSRSTPRIHCNLRKKSLLQVLSLEALVITRFSQYWSRMLLNCYMYVCARCQMHSLNRDKNAKINIRIRYTFVKELKII